MRFEWDPAKAAANRRKHGVSFETAARVFADPYALFEQDRTVDGGCGAAGADRGLPLQPARSMALCVGLAPLRCR